MRGSNARSDEDRRPPCPAPGCGFDVSQDSTLRWPISASSSRSWRGAFGARGDRVITTSPNEVPAVGGVGRLSMCCDSASRAATSTFGVDAGELQCA